MTRRLSQPLPDQRQSEPRIAIFFHDSGNPTVFTFLTQKGQLLCYTPVVGHRGWVVAVCLLWACTGEIGQPGSSDKTGFENLDDGGAVVGGPVGPGSPSSGSPSTGSPGTPGSVSPGPGADNTPGSDGASDPAAPISIVPGASSAIPRLSRREIETSIQDIFGLSGLALSALPPDADTAVNPKTGAEETIFDTFAGTLGDYVPSEVFIQGLSTLAFEVADRVSSNRAKVDALAGCKPSGAQDANCMRALIDSLGPRLYRRPLKAAERSRLQALAAELTSGADFYTGARAVIQSLVQSPDFVYRPEIGAEVQDGVHELDNFELLARLSFLFWGAPPSSELLQQAAGPALSDAELEDIVRSMAADPRTDLQIRNMHAMWLRYEDALVTDAQLRSQLLTETEALLDRVLSDPNRPWSELFTSPETYIGPGLAAHYGMTDKPVSTSWVRYENPERAGILSHGSYLSLSSTKGNETLPSRRGAMIARQILCRSIPGPPPDVDIDDGVEVAPGACKSDAYEAHKASSACAGCHSLIDSIGFGFERFDGLGAYRSVERDNPGCGIDGLGSDRGQSFSGPAEFVELATQSGDLTQCGTDQLMRFALRRSLEGADDRGLAKRLHSSFLGSGEDFRTLLVELALDPSFRHRRDKP